MTKCRACLKPARNMLAFDEKTLLYFNLLTNLNLQPCNDELQQMCKGCHKTLQLCIDFREKCIAANLEFNDIISKQSIKQEDIEETKNEISIEYDIKEELFSHHEDHMSDDLGEDLGHIECDSDAKITYELLWKTEEKTEENESKKAREENNKSIKTLDSNEPCEENCDPKSAKKGKGKKKRIRTLDKDLSCGLCEKTFENRALLVSHVITHKADRCCSICYDKFMDWQQALSHRIKHLTIKKQPCLMCSRRFSTATYLECHYRKYHSEGEDPSMKCSYCSRSYGSAKRLLYHIKHTHIKAPSGNTHHCDLCGKVFPDKSRLKSHLNFHTDNKPYSCELCDYSAKTKTNLKNHVLRRHNPSRVYCRKCSGVFRSQAAHDAHVCCRTQMGTICPVCGKSCRSNKALLVHMESHDVVGRYQCPQCPRKFKHRAGLSVHVDKHNGAPRNHCEYCPAKFYFGSALTKHRRIHTGIKPYVCKVCQRGFTGSHNLKVHMRVHGEYNLIIKNNTDEESPVLDEKK